MTDDQIKIFLKLIQIRPVKQALNGDEPVFESWIYTSDWMKRNHATQKSADMALDYVIFEAKAKK